mgnify:CR=1 FL=1
MALGDVIARLAVNLSLETAAFEKGATKSEKRMNQMQRKFSDFGKKIAIGGAAITGAVLSINKVFDDLAQKSKEMGNAAAVAGEGFEAFQRQAYAAKTVGIEFGKLGDIFKDVRERVGEFVVNGGGPLQDAFDALRGKVKLTVDELRGLSGKDALQLIVSRMEQAKLSTEEMSFVLESLGSDATALLPLLRNNAQAFDELGGKAAVITDEQRAQLQRYTDSMASLDNSLQRLALTLVDSGLIDKFAGLAEQLSALTEGFSGVEVAVDSADAKFKNTQGARTFGEGLREVSDRIENFRLGYGLAMDEWMAQNTAAREQIAGWVTSVGTYFNNLATTARQSMERMYVEVKGWLQDKLGAVFTWVQNKIKAVERSFYWLADQVVFNSHVPDMVNLVGQHMARLDQVMVRPAVEAVQKVNAAFAGMGSTFTPPGMGGADRLAALGDTPEASNDNAQEGIIAQAERWQTALQNVGSTFEGVAGSIADLISQIINPAVNSSIERFSQMQSAMQGITGLFQKLFGKKAGGIIGGIVQIGASFFGGGGKIPGFATGTNYAPGGLALVGERGPELVSMPRGSRVFTNRESMGMMGGGKLQVEVIANNDGFGAVIRDHAGQMIAQSTPFIMDGAANIAHARMNRNMGRPSTPGRSTG